MLTNCSKKCATFNEALNMHSRGPAEQHFYIWEPHHGCLNKVKKVRWCSLIKEGKWSHKYAFWRANGAIKMKIALVLPCSILLDTIKFNGRQINKSSHSHNYSRKSENAIVSLRLSILHKWNRKSTSLKFAHIKFVNAFSNRGFLGRPHIHTFNII